MKEIKNIIKDNDFVKIKIVKNTITISNSANLNHRPTIRKINNHKHINLRTGEIVEEKRSIKRGESVRTLLESNIKLQDIIKENAVDNNKIILLTLTYEEKTLDIKRINEDFKSFIKYLRKNVVEFGAIEYINTLELYADKTGYHIHAILFFNESTKSVYLPFETLSKAWKLGQFALRKPTRDNEVYFYLTPHLSKKVNDKNSHMHNKALLQMELPAGVNLYRCSKGIKKPVIYTDTYENIQKYLKQNSYELNGQQIYLNPMQTYHGNNLYYCKEQYKKSTETITITKNKRKPI
ncbi:MAG: hypothetical protein IJW59_05035 [Clostridia bacterium]|nr:hypothetical protein [Clostridia bacterium]